MTHQITINWDASPSPISGYNIYRGTALGNESSTPINNTPVTGTTYTDDTVFAGLSYSYKVKSVLNSVESTLAIEIESAPVPFPTFNTLDLGAASGFGLLASSTITNVPASTTIVSGDVGVSPGTSVTGFVTPALISGSFHLGDFVSGFGQASLTAAFNNAMAIPGGVTMLGNIGGETLLPGVYKSASSLGITGQLILDAQSNPNATWIFQIGSTLTTAADNSNIILVGGAAAANIFWVVGSSATIGAGTTFAGNILAYASITVNSGAYINGRILARTGAITLDGNNVIIFQPCDLNPLPPSPPNVAPAAPEPPTNIHITSEL